MRGGERENRKKVGKEGNGCWWRYKKRETGLKNESSLDWSFLHRKILPQTAEFVLTASASASVSFFPLMREHSCLPLSRFQVLKNFFPVRTCDSQNNILKLWLSFVFYWRRVCTKCRPDQEHPPSSLCSTFSSEGIYRLAVDLKKVHLRDKDFTLITHKIKFRKGLSALGELIFLPFFILFSSLWTAWLSLTHVSCFCCSKSLYFSSPRFLWVNWFPSTEILTRFSPLSIEILYLEDIEDKIHRQLRERHKSLHPSTWEVEGESSRLSVCLLMLRIEDEVNFIRRGRERDVYERESLQVI